MGLVFKKRWVMDSTDVSVDRRVRRFVLRGPGGGGGGGGSSSRFPRNQLFSCF